MILEQHARSAHRRTADAPPDTPTDAGRPARCPPAPVAALRPRPRRRCAPRPAGSPTPSPPSPDAGRRTSPGPWPPPGPGLDHRAVVLGADRGALLAGLDALRRRRRRTAGRPGAGHRPDRQAGRSCSPARAPAGRHGTRAARRASRCSPPRSTRCCAAARRRGPGCRSREVLLGRGGVARGGLLDQTVYTQAALFALEVALFRLVESWGVRPDFLARALDRRDRRGPRRRGVLAWRTPCRLVAARGRLMQATPAGRRDGRRRRRREEEVAGLLADGERAVAIAAVNGPRSRGGLRRRGGGRGVAERWAPTAAAPGGSPSATPSTRRSWTAMLDRFREALDGSTLARARDPGRLQPDRRPVAAGQLGSAEYWVRHVREAGALRRRRPALLGQGVTGLPGARPGRRADPP